MTLTYKRSESTISPPLIDATSSKKVVYIRKDIVEKQRTDKTTGELYIYYEYLEAKILKSEYGEHLQKQTRADLDYLALMMGVDLEESEESEWREVE